jgi:endonuclease/exonuclease/phosphatase family metal-dependent hydrolase
MGLDFALVRICAFALCALAAVSWPAPGIAADIKIATWNLNWLTSRSAGTFLPADVTPRGPGDFDLLRHYAEELDADVIAFQEVDHRETAARIFPPDRYSIHMARDHVMQRVGFAVRRGLRYEIHPDIDAIRLGPEQHLRSGVDMTLLLPGGSIRLLAVHLKKGCADQNVLKPVGRSCLALHDQIGPLRDWIAARARDGAAFIILGDFNRRMDSKDPFIAALKEAAPLARATQGRSSPCWGAEGFIDHILAGGPASGWMRSDSLRVMTYRESGPGWKDRLSDHCPVSVRFAVPD